MHFLRILVGAMAVIAGTAVPASAQRFPFERSIDVAGATTLDVSTVRGKIDVSPGEPGRIVVSGTVTVRIGWNVPANAVDLARKIAAGPPIHHDARKTTLTPPADDAERRAVTVAYSVRVPPHTRVITASESGATIVRGVSGAVTVRSQSGEIELAQLGGATEVTTGSGAVTIDGVSETLSVTTSSGGIAARSLGGGVRVRTDSGSVVAELTGTGDANVETGSSAIRIAGARGGVHASSRSGRVVVNGTPNRAWSVSSGSGGLDIGIEPKASFALDATTGSGDVTVEGAPVQGTVTKRKVAGDVGSGGPLVRANSRSGSIRVQVGR